MNYYKSLATDKKKEIKKEFLANKEESTIYSKINRIYVLSIIGVVLGVLSSTFDILYKMGTVNYVLDGLLIIFSVLFLIKTIKMKSDELNKYSLKIKDAIK